MLCRVVSCRVVSCLCRGEYAEWEKRTNWELGVRIPLIMRVPWLPSASSGKHARGLVEAVDIYQVCVVVFFAMKMTFPDEATPICQDRLGTGTMKADVRICMFRTD